ncbi:MAG: asparagine synthetase B [Candidatus Eisenbacteria bacterium]|nr:asparagine synthetase B [Candidatus Eisenbacteria bacterium]
MCGICGSVCLDDRPFGSDEDRARRRSVEGMLAALSHDASDAAGIESDSRACLGAARLAVPGRTQGAGPARHSSGVIAACHGEIDNLAEVRKWLAGRGADVATGEANAILAALYLEAGDSFVERIDGAFALAVWDPGKGSASGPRLLLARDRVGERPLHYGCRSGLIHFATHIPALAEGIGPPLAAHAFALARYLREGYFLAPETPFAELKKVGPAELIIFRRDRSPEFRRYWRWSIAESPKRDARPDEFDSIFRAAVHRQTDVPGRIGVFLSGGIDSSLVTAALCAERGRDAVKAYTLRFREPSYDEGEEGLAVAKALGCESSVLGVRAEDYPDALARLIADAGAPLADPAWIPSALLARHASHEVKRIVVGEGADEVFGGYPAYIGAWLAEAYARMPRLPAGWLRGVIERWPASDRKVTFSFLLKRFVAGAHLHGLERHRLWSASVAPSILERLRIEDPARAPLAAEAPRADAELPLLDLLQRHDLETSLAEAYLMKADASARFGRVELRAPFLDRTVIEFAACLPPAARVDRWRTKVFLKRYGRGRIPGAVIRRRKRGLSVPLAAWLRGPLHGWAQARLGDERLGAAGISPARALELLREHERRAADHARALWTVIVLDEWLRWAEQRESARRAALSEPRGALHVVHGESGATPIARKR